MTLEKQKFFRRYTALMLEYVQSPDEGALLAIEQLGHEMVRFNIPPEDLGEMHDAAIGELMASSDLDPKKIRAASSPLMQLLMAYGIAFREVRARHEIEQALIESQNELKVSEERWKFALEGAGDGVWDFNFQTGINVISKRMKELLGFDVSSSPDEHFFNDWVDRLHPDSRAKTMELFQEVEDNKTDCYTIEQQVRHENGHYIWLLTRGKVVSRHEDGRPVRLIGTASDITERKEAEELLRKLSSAVDQAGECIMITNTKGIIEYVNPAFTTVTGYRAEEAIGQTPKLLNSGNQDAAFYQAMWNTITAGKTWQGKVIDKRKDGSFYPAMLSISPILDGSGDLTHFTHFIGIQSDLSQLENMEQRFHQAQKMEAIGTMVGGIAHNFNNMLAGITGNLYLAKQSVQAQPDVVERLTTVEEISHHAADMIAQLLAFARKGTVSIKSMPLAPFIKETLKLLSAAVPENIDFHQAVCANDLFIKGDATMLHQVVANLISNARDAVANVDKPCITLLLEPFQADAMLIKKKSYFKTGSYAHLSVADNGIGIPKHQLKHLFEPFFTTKEQGKGTGLGLSMVYGALKTHHGFVEVDSKLGSGTTFHLYIPLLKSNKLISKSIQKQQTIEGQGELILLADDEPIVREVTTEILKSLGYRVLTAADGIEALEQFMQRQQEISLLLLDVVMPHLGGELLAQKVRAINPDIPVLFLTGYDQKRVLTDNKQVTNSALLTKPVDYDLLSHKIRQLLD